MKETFGKADVIELFLNAHTPGHAALPCLCCAVLP
jgi:hypothetical protein